MVIVRDLDAVIDDFILTEINASEDHDNSIFYSRLKLFRVYKTAWKGRRNMRVFEK